MDSKQLLDVHPLLSDRTRLAILATLAADAEPLEFGAILEALGLTKGNLSSHIRKLEEGELVLVEKEFVARKSRTTYRLTDAGSQALRQYLQVVEALLTGSVGTRDAKTKAASKK